MAIVPREEYDIIVNEQKKVRVKKEKNNWKERNKFNRKSKDWKIGRK